MHKVKKENPEMNAALQPFDLAKMDYEANRLKKRRQLLRRSILPVAVVALVALWFLLPTTLTHQAINAYKHQHYKPARHWLTPLTWSSPDSFVAAFNSGTVDTQLGRYDQAQTELTRALALATPRRRCMAVQNLVYSLQAHAKSLPANNKDANTYQTKALNLAKTYSNCFGGASGGQQGGGGGSSASSNAQDTDKSEAPSLAQQQQLQQLEQQGQERKQQDIYDQTFDPSSPNLKQW